MYSNIVHEYIKKHTFEYVMNVEYDAYIAEIKIKLRNRK